MVDDTHAVGVVTLEGTPEVVEQLDAALELVVEKQLLKDRERQRHGLLW